MRCWPRAHPVVADTIWMAGSGSGTSPSVRGAQIRIVVAGDATEPGVVEGPAAEEGTEVPAGALDVFCACLPEHATARMPTTTIAATRRRAILTC
jgi:hypothetical protein